MSQITLHVQIWGGLIKANGVNWSHSFDGTRNFLSYKTLHKNLNSQITKTLRNLNSWETFITNWKFCIYLKHCYLTRSILPLFVIFHNSDLNQIYFMILTQLSQSSGFSSFIYCSTLFILFFSYCSCKNSGSDFLLKWFLKGGASLLYEEGFIS